MLATPTEVLPSGDGWAWEMKWDGVRALAAIVRGGWKLIDTGTTVELYRVHDDPGEKSNLSASKPQMVDELRKLQSGVEEQANVALGNAQLQVDEEVVRHALERLEATLRARTATGF